MKLKDKTAIITGAARGLGKAIALAFAREGADIAAVDLNLPEIEATTAEVRALGRRALAIKADVSKWDEVERMANLVNQQLGKIDVLVNNAAVWAGLQGKPFFQITEEEWDRLMAVNVKGVFLCCKSVFPFMKDQGKGKIVNISSAVHFIGAPYLVHYATSKGGVVAFTRSLARELGDFNIMVNAVAPGFTMTEAGKEMVNKEMNEMIVARRSLKREEQPEDLTGVITFLSSDESDFITGQTIVVDGGVALH
jgi:NAD(P)-dependent dehydrogenase (short-subunit alcohol dehydrogenase family)